MRQAENSTSRKLYTICDGKRHLSFIVVSSVGPSQGPSWMRPRPLVGGMLLRCCCRESLHMPSAVLLTFVLHAGRNKSSHMLEAGRLQAWVLGLVPLLATAVTAQADLPACEVRPQPSRLLTPCGHHAARSNRLSLCRGGKSMCWTWACLRRSMAWRRATSTIPSA